MIRGNYTSFFDIIILGDFMKKIVNEYVFDYSMLQKFYRINLQTKSYLVLLLLVLISTISSFFRFLGDSLRFLDLLVQFLGKP